MCGYGVGLGVGTRVEGWLLGALVGASGWNVGAPVIDHLQCGLVVHTFLHGMPLHMNHSLHPPEYLCPTHLLPTQIAAGFLMLLEYWRHDPDGEVQRWFNNTHEW